MRPLAPPAASRPARMLGAFAVLLALLTFVSCAHAASPVSVFPIPGDRVANPDAQIVIRGVPTTQFGSITVTGSKSGVHAGKVKADSDGQGGSFIPARPFTPGETVTVATSLDVAGATNGSWSFSVLTPAGPISSRPLKLGPRTKHDVWTFRTLPHLQPAAVTVTALHKGRSAGDLFFAPQAGPLQNGPEILNSVGRLVYFHPIPRGQFATNVDVQTYNGSPALTWWQGEVTTSGTGRGVDEIYNSSYRHVATVRAANGLTADLHEFLLGPGDTAWLTAYEPVIVNASPIKHGSRRETVFDGVAQEIDLKTGLVLWQWDSLDHVALRHSYSPVPAKPTVPWDYFHINSVQPLSDGTVLVSSRNTSAVYDVSETGAVNWVVGGKHSTFTLGPGARFYYQHDARLRSNGQLTMFDDAGSPFRETQSRGLTLNLNMKKQTATVASQVTHSPLLRAPAEGSNQPLPNGNTLIGWGKAEDLATEYSPNGKALFDARFNGRNASYRVFRDPWTGTPTGRPLVATHTYHGQLSVSASWNGTTVTHRWRILGGDSATSLTQIADDLKRRFETTMQTHRNPRFVEVEAMSASGKVLGRSKVVRAR